MVRGKKKGSFSAAMGAGLKIRRREMRDQLPPVQIARRLRVLVLPVRVAIGPVGVALKGISWTARAWVRGSSS